VTRQKRKVQRRFVYNGYGFPVVLRNVPMVMVRGSWTPNINYNVLTQKTLYELAHKPVRLTGDEVRFIRHSFDMTLTEFGKERSVKAATVTRWEKAGEKATSMKWLTEKRLRASVLAAQHMRDSVKNRAIGALWMSLEKKVESREEAIVIDCERKTFKGLG